MKNECKSNDQLARLLDVAIKISMEAGSNILKVYSKEIQVTQKNDGSPLTCADLLAHKIIVHGLSATGLPTLSEESVVPFHIRNKWSKFWLVDPLDGTKDFIKRNDEFTVNIALVENGVPIIGVVMAPALDTIWFAARGIGAWKIEAGIKGRIIASKGWPESRRMFISRFHADLDALKFGLLNKIDKTIYAGSSLKLVRLAESEAEFYPRFTGSSEWDTAAGEVILREAGGFIKSVRGVSLAYNKKSTRNPHFIAWRPPFKFEDMNFHEE